MDERLSQERVDRLIAFLVDVEAGRAASFVPADLRALFEELNALLVEVETLRKERDEARAALAALKKEAGR